MRSIHHYRLSTVIVLILLGSFALNAQDILVTSFETNTVGSIHGQGDWILETGSASITNAPGDVHSESQSLLFQVDNGSLVLHNITFDGNQQGVSGIVYLDLYVKINSLALKDFAISGYDLFGGGSEKRTFVLEFDTPNGTSGLTQMFNGGSRIDLGHYNLGEWNRLSARIDYVNAGYQVIYNGSDAVSGSFRETYTPTASGTRPAGIKEYHALRFNLGYDSATGSVDAALDDIYISTTPIPDVAFPELIITHTLEYEQPEIGSISVNPDLDEYPDSTEVTASLWVPDGYLNSGWTGDLSGTELSKTFFITSDMEFSANVAVDSTNPPTQYTVAVTQPTYGTITLTPPGGLYYDYTNVTATLTVPTSFMNQGWTGDLSGTDLEQTFVIHSNMSIGAVVVYDDTPPTIYEVSTASAFEDICESDDLRPGDIIQLADGVYDTGGISMETSGTSSEPIIIRAAHIGGAVLAGESYFSLRRSEYITIEGFHFTSDRYTVIKLEACNNIRITRNTFQITETEGQNGKWVYIGGVWDEQDRLSHHNRIDHNIFRDKHQLGNFITIDGGDNVSQHDRIDHNYFYNIGPRHDNEMEAIRVGWSELSLTNGYTVIEYNLFEDCDGDPEIISIKSCKDTVRYNTIKRSQGTVSLRHGDGSVIHDNFFLGDGKDGTGGVRVYARNHKIYNNYFSNLTGSLWDAAITLTNGDTDTGSLSAHWRIDNVSITHNTLVNNYSNIEIGYGCADNSWSREPRNVTMANNLVVGSQKDLIEIINEPTNFTWSGNIMFPQGGFGIGMEAGTNEINNIDPLLTNVNSDSLWLLSEASPARDAALVNYLNISQDVQGQPRSGVNDVGADEYAVSTVYRHPLTIDDVGPNAWEVVSVMPGPQILPQTFQLLNAYPNPFNPSSRIEYSLSQTSNVQLSIYNILGQKIESLIDGRQDAGVHSIQWEAKGQPAGIYLAVLNNGFESKTTKMVLIK
ncbi:MAG: T9SS type A sorting domain-containing protein [Candidatus Marinimicrobia bacterium]|nr:T9SS type A sorting domain-containing protein [Candidatus Neomarinimicrobiota bacterium]